MPWLGRNNRAGWQAIEKAAFGCEGVYDDVEYFEELFPKDASVEDFYGEYLYAMFAAGIGNTKGFETHFGKIRSVTDNCNPVFVAADPDGVRSDLLKVNRNAKKVDWAVNMALELRSNPQRWLNLQPLGLHEVLVELKKLPGIGSTNRYHMARNLGWDTPVIGGFTGYLADQLGCAPEDLVQAIGRLAKRRTGTVDYILWAWADKLFESPDDAVKSFKLKVDAKQLLKEA